MNLQAKELFFSKMNELHEKKTPFFFLVDFLCSKTEILPLKDLMQENILFKTPAKSNISEGIKPHKILEWEKYPISENAYKLQFEQVKTAIQAGDTYLLNLTCTTPIKTNYSLKELFSQGHAKYKLYYKDIFTHFSPEPFIQINNDKIYAYPMKGTIDGTMEEAGDNILANEKELCEQFTIVDLIRNDLSIVAKNVRVDDFRYIEKISTNQKELLSVSSKISGNIREQFLNNPGAIFSALLPAGSICGAPKAKTLEIIAQTEKHDRKYYTGVWGIFDGEQIDSCVIIRYIENTENGMVFKSGGGITSMSDPSAEYQEMIDKIYAPIY
ncbi:aminodeoxychorismate synthase component I [Arachidicoccus sp.]|uniref:aminodeoxychorismate synthase component I n=1 Tax=Arachidicoccus sp. TaxID=1872624 RepID=UPI003D1ADF23